MSEENTTEEIAEERTEEPTLRTESPSEEQLKESQRRAVKLWTKRIKDSKKKWDVDFQRMRSNIEFSAGLQWRGQKNLVDEDRYINNIVLRAINQKVAQLYARNPKSSAKRRARMDFQIWDEKMESLQLAVMSMQQAQMATTAGIPSQMPMEAMALIQDYQQGKARREIVDRICRTLEIVYDWQVQQQEPEFKLQMKNLVRRVVTTGVGYVKLCFERNVYPTLDDPAPMHSMTARAKRAKAILEQYLQGDLEPDDPQIETLRSLTASLTSSVQRGEEGKIEERLVFTFPSASSIIIDKKCTSLKGFVHADWIAEEFILPVGDVNALFETDINVGENGSATEYFENGEEATPSSDSSETDKENEPLVCVWQVWDKTTRSCFFICDGYKEYVLPPEPVTPPTNRFWPLFSLTFNDVDSDPRAEASIFPPSDVELMKHAQREWNRTREALRQQRKANAPRWLTGKGWLSDADVSAIERCKPNHVALLESVSPQDDLTKKFIRAPVAPIDPAMYDTKPLAEDIQYAAGTQEANLGPTSPNVTATVGTIAEQSRMTMSTSNVDDLDDLLSDMAKAGGEILLLEMSIENVKRVAGVGAAWPEQEREDFLNEVYLEVMAASSGRPNKAIEIANFERLAPLMLRAGANPKFIVEEGTRRLDDRLEIDVAFPLIPQAPTQGQAPASPEQPLQSLPSEAPVPLAGA